jgi:hypothetical protein
MAARRPRGHLLTRSARRMLGEIALALGAFTCLALMMAAAKALGLTS